MTAVTRTDNYLCIKVSGRCMEPAIAEGDFVFVDRDAAPQDGDVCVVLLRGECALGRLTRRPDGEMQLVPDNKDRQYPAIMLDDPEARRIGVVIKSWRDYGKP